MHARLFVWACLSAVVSACFESDSQDFDGIFVGQIEELFGQTSGLIKVKRVIIGDHRYQGHFIILQDLKNCPNIRPVKLRDTRIFSVKTIHEGVFTLVSPLLPITWTNLRRTEIRGGSRRHHRSHILGKLSDKSEKTCAS